MIRKCKLLKTIWFIKKNYIKEQLSKEKLKEEAAGVGESIMETLTTEEDDLNESETKVKEIDEQVVGEGGYDMQRKRIYDSLDEKPKAGTPNYYIELQKTQQNKLLKSRQAIDALLGNIA